MNKEAKISVIGLGPGDPQMILPLALDRIAKAEVVIGYHYYFQFIEEVLRPESECIAMELAQEQARAEKAIEVALSGRSVAVIGSGDAGIYAMASLVYEEVARQQVEINLETIPGISAFLAAGSKLGAPLGHDFCCISLSDLMTPWPVIEKRIKAAAMGDFVTSLYNPKSKKRYWQLYRFKELFLEERLANTPVAICRQVGRPEEQFTLTTLAEFDPEQVDMFSLVMVGNSQTFQYKSHLVTPRGYLNRKAESGKAIQVDSFRQITEKLTPDSSIGNWWAKVRLIHTTGDFIIAEKFQSYNSPIEKWEQYLKDGGTIVTDVTMVQAGITKSFVEKYGNQVICLLNESEVPGMVEDYGITRTQAGIRLAMEQYPNALYVVGNAPTALIDIADAIHLNGFVPAGLIAAPVGFVNVLEAKERVRLIKQIPWVVVEGRPGGSNLAAALVNAAFTLEEAKKYSTYGEEIRISTI
ncbi:precorrin-3B C(17)-methyltransferase [Cytophagales bacterium RKSG123]|nr:precorrin-3B C(17)-methyltransferase [Xanthovirga aplysinae]